MSQENEINPGGADLSAMIGLRLARVVLSKFQLDLFFIDELENEAAIVTFENEIDLKTSDRQYAYDIQHRHGLLPFNELIGRRVVDVSYVEGDALFLEFEGGVDLKANSSSSGNESGLIRVFRGATRFMMPFY